MPGGMVAQLSIGPPPPNQAPVAENDFATTVLRTRVYIDVIANDSDPDGVLDPASVVITSGFRTPGRARVYNLGDGTIQYRAIPGFTGPDTFTYTVDDDSGETSNEATVTVVVTP